MLSRLDTERQDSAYRFYVCTSLQLAPQGKNLVKSYNEFLDDIKNPKKEKTGDEIAIEILTKLGVLKGR